jgi:hypothetical protein
VSLLECTHEYHLWAFSEIRKTWRHVIAYKSYLRNQVNLGGTAMTNRPIIWGDFFVPQINKNLYRIKFILTPNYSLKINLLWFFCKSLNFLYKTQNFVKIFRKYFDIAQICIKKNSLYHFLSKSKQNYPLVTEK